MQFVKHKESEAESEKIAKDREEIKMIEDFKAKNP
jgi:hypothetical protein